MEEKIIKEIQENVLFSKEAAEYLNISPQRIHQLVQSGQLRPIKKSSAGSLFLKNDLDERRNDTINIAGDINNIKKVDLEGFETSFMRELFNYYTVQSFNSFSDKKTEKLFESLSKTIDLTKEIEEIAAPLSESINVSVQNLISAYKKIKESFKKLDKDDYIIKKGSPEYPFLLSMTEEAPPYLFMRGNIELLKENIVSVVGSRKASNEGLVKSYRLSKYLGKAGIVVASGLAHGIDTAAHKAALENNYKTIAVIGTPLTKVYPKENSDLQKQISKEGLVVSQFPPSSDVQRWHFPMRNAIMSGISLATAIVEASETSGALKQADYALKQKRLVFIPQSALENQNIKWPKKYLTRPGAKKFSKIEELLKILMDEEIIIEDPSQINLFGEGDEPVYVNKLK